MNWVWQWGVSWNCVAHGGGEVAHSYEPHGLCCFRQFCATWYLIHSLYLLSEACLPNYQCCGNVVTELRISLQVSLSNLSLGRVHATSAIITWNIIRSNNRIWNWIWMRIIIGWMCNSALPALSSLTSVSNCFEISSNTGTAKLFPLWLLLRGWGWLPNPVYQDPLSETLVMFCTVGICIQNSTKPAFQVVDFVRLVWVIKSKFSTFRVLCS